jgi:hypothetical protein
VHTNIFIIFGISDNICGGVGRAHLREKFVPQSVKNLYLEEKFVVFYLGEKFAPR